MKIHKKLLTKNFEGKLLKRGTVIVAARIYNKKLCDVALDSILCSREPKGETKTVLFRSARREAVRIMKLVYRSAKNRKE